MNSYLEAKLGNTVNTDTKGKGKPFEIVEGIWTWFGRPEWLYDASVNKYWVGCVVCGIQHILEYDIASDTYDVYPVGTIFENDDHNKPCLLKLSGSNKILAVYTGHNADYLEYRISTNPLDASSWDAPVDITQDGLKSYPSPYQSSTGDIYIFYRARDVTTPRGFQTTCWMYTKSTDTGATWSSQISFYEYTLNTGYLISHQDGDKIHFCATPGNPSEQGGGSNQFYTYHFYFDMSTDTFHKSDGTSITLPCTPSNMTLVDSHGTGEAMWICDIITESGNPRILYVYFPDAATLSFSGNIGDRGTFPPHFKERYIKYADWNGTSWETKTLYKGGDKYIGSLDSDGIQPAYSAIPAFVNNNTDKIVAPIAQTKNGVSPYELFLYDVTNDGFQQLTFDSPNDNWRPLSIPASRNNVVWCQNVKYDSPADFKTKILTKTVDVS